VIRNPHLEFFELSECECHCGDNKYNAADLFDDARVFIQHSRAMHCPLSAVCNDEEWNGGAERIRTKCGKGFESWFIANEREREAKRRASTWDPHKPECHSNKKRTMLNL
jgi:hypothetical protein